MKEAKEWRLGSMGDNKISPGSRHRPHSKRPIWIILTVSLVSFLLFFAYLYPKNSDVACYIFSSRGCRTLSDWLPPAPIREFTDEEVISRVVIRDILNTPPVQSKNPKIAFMFLTPGSLPFEKLWDLFFRVQWGAFNMVDAEKRLLAYALKDPDNQHFVLLSDSCVPLHNFDHVYNYLMNANMSFIDCFVDLGPHGNGRYSEHMLPEVEEKDFRKGAQWFTMKRQHAMVVMADSLYYSRFKEHCKPFFDGKNCIADEHYFPTFFHLIDPGGISNWSVTYVDWSERKWHPKSYKAQDVTYELLRNITVHELISLFLILMNTFYVAWPTLNNFRSLFLQSLDQETHITSNDKGDELLQPCLWNGIRRPCFLFARKFYPEALDKLVTLLNF